MKKTFKHEQIIPLSEARLCVNCEAVINCWSCPVCGSKNVYYLTKFLNRGDEDHDNRFFSRWDGESDL
jgi:hypothetical protein